jgi:hypothetical protein
MIRYWQPLTGFRVNQARGGIVPVMRIAFSSMILSLLVATSAIAQDVHYNFAWDTQFKKFRTYKWVEIKDAQKVDEMKDREIKAAVDAKLAKEGLTKTDADTADLYIGYQAGLSAEKQFASYNSDWGDGPGWYQEGWYVLGQGAIKGETSTIYAGQLGVDMYDSKNHCLVWRGVVSKALDPTATPEKQEKSLEKSVNKLLKRYPPHKHELPV